jgi:4-hydroxybenzoate polyprenyltransferase
MSPLSHWGRFVRERFPPATHLPMVALFVLANAGTAGPGLIAALAVTLSFFFRLRLFDEIKDYAVDRAVNPDRPLARGLLGVGEVQRVCVALVAGELVVCALLSSRALAIHTVAIAYSLLMYREFFIGRWLRRHLTTYAVTHTIVTVPLGWSVAVQVGGPAVWRVALVNWMLFNVFEFARKTHAPAEERPNVDSYSRLFTPAGAAALTLSQVALAVVLVGSPAWQVALATVLILAAGVYVGLRTVGAARLFRGTAAAYILAFYAVLAWQRWQS